LTLLDLSEARRAAASYVPQSSKSANSALPNHYSRVAEDYAPLVFYGSPADFEGGFRRISQPTSPWRDLLPPMQWNMQRVCYYLYVTNPQAHRIVELIKDFIVGEGISYTAQDRRVQEVIEEFWTDPVNQMDENLEHIVRDTSIFGETVWYATSNPISGKTRLGYIDPYWIDGVEYATLAGLPGKAMAFASAIVLRTGPTEPVQTTLKVIQRDEEPGSATYGRLTGNCFYHTVNKARSGHRGFSDLFPLADWLDGHDQMLWAFLNQMDALGRFVWDVTLNGMTGEQVQQWLKDNGTPPRPGSVRAHNEKVTWQALAPAINATDKSAAAQLIKTNIITGAGLPVPWMSEGAHSNRATALTQGEPALKMLTSRQRAVKRLLRLILDYVIDCSVAAGALPETVDRSYTLNFPELSTDDQQAIATALNQTAQGLVALEAIDVVDKRTIAQFVASLAQQQGIEINPDEMLQAAAADSQRKQARGAQTDSPDPLVAQSSRRANSAAGSQKPESKAGPPGTWTEGPPGTIATGGRDGSSAMSDGMLSAAPDNTL